MTASRDEHRPPSVDPQALRQAMRHVASPVAVVTVAGEEEMRGITIGSFTSLSLDPPLISFNVQRDSQMHPVITEASRFAVHIVSDDQAHLCNHFSLPDLTGEQQFELVDYEVDGYGTPVLSGVVAVLHCTPHTRFEAGDHTVIVAEVLDLHVSSERRPVLYYDQAYHQLGGEVRSSLFDPVNEESSSTS